MWRNSPKIGFDDRPVLIIGISTFSLFIPIIFFGWRFWHAPYLTWPVYWPCLLITACIWISSRYIMIWARKRYPLFREVKRRLWVQNSIILLSALIYNNILGNLLDKYCETIAQTKANPLSGLDILINSNAATICPVTKSAMKGGAA